LRRYIIAITGASGVIYGVRLVDELLRRDFEIHLIVSKPALIVMKQELGWDCDSGIEVIKQYFQGNIYYYDIEQIDARIASGSFLTDGMVVIPCTMSTLSAISTGSSGNLLERTADVILKEKKQLILVPRETPLNSIHLRNMLELSYVGAHIIPAMPAFYNKPRSLDDIVNFMVGKIMDAMRIPHNIYNRYQG